MTYFQKLFNPSSIAVIGASHRPGSVGAKIFQNLQNHKFTGTVYPVNPKYQEIAGQPCFPSVEAIHGPIDLAIIATPAQTVRTIMEACGKKHIPTAIIISSGFSEIGKSGQEAAQEICHIARQYHIRFIGPNCLGMMRPSIKLNATFDQNTALPGKIALVSQSGALCSAILDWATTQKLGFSMVISLGNSADLDFSDILDFLTADPETESILLYIEGIKDANAFMQALEAATRKKPVIVMKAGRFEEGSKAAHTHTGALIGNDLVFEAAMRRAGAVRVFSIEQLFSVIRLLAHTTSLKGNRLAIITNGGGAGVMAADQAAELNIPLANLSQQTLKKLNNHLPIGWSHQNPIDIIGDATPKRYEKAIQICSQDPNIDVMLILLVPVAMVNPIQVAHDLIEKAKNISKPILACWMGEHRVQAAWHLFVQNQLPYFETPESAMDALACLMKYHQNQSLLSQNAEHPEKYRSSHSTITTPSSDTTTIQHAQKILEKAIQENRQPSPSEAKTMLNIFQIPINQTLKANTSEEAVTAAEQLGFPIAMKINSPDILHKQDIGGVQLNLKSSEAVQHAFQAILKQAKTHVPKANILGVTLEQMIHHRYDRELMVGIFRDKLFGPVMSFGMGGTWVEIIHDQALALLPLNIPLAKDLISRTKISKALRDFRGMPAVHLDHLVTILLRMSDLALALPQIQEIEINPLLANHEEMVAIDASIMIASINR